MNRVVLALRAAEFARVREDLADIRAKASTVHGETTNRETETLADLVGRLATNLERMAVLQEVE